MCNIRILSNSELHSISSNGNGFSKIEHAEAVSKNRAGKEAIIKKDDLYFLCDANNIKTPKTLSNNQTYTFIEFVDANNSISNIKSTDGIKGVGEKLTNDILSGKAKAGNNFRKFSDAESVAKNLPFDTAIVNKNNTYALYKITPESTQKILKGDNSLLDGKFLL